MTASGARIDVGDRSEAKRLMSLRQAWQPEAWVYRRNLGELRYAVTYLGNSAQRMRLFPGCWIPDNEAPVSIADAAGMSSEDTGGLDLPDELIADAHDALNRLGSGGPLALAQLMKRLTENFEVAGECFLVGEDDDDTGESWDVRSTSEVVVSNDGRFGYRNTPLATGAASGDVTYVDTSPLSRTFVSRLWVPDPEWRVLADSPVRACLDILEELLLAGKEVRAHTRSRLANNGILKVPSELEVVHANAVDVDDEDDPFLAELMAAATAALTDEGAASAVVPLIVKGKAEALKGLEHMPIKRDAPTESAKDRQELIGRLATGLDLPAEVLTGKVDLNHWTAWQVDDDAFRHHIEPVVVTEVDALTTGYLWVELESRGHPRALVRQVVVWYDPTALLTHPDRSKDAFAAHESLALSDEALRRYLGFPDTDAPDDLEVLRRIALKIRTLDPAIQAAIFKRLDPTLPDPVNVTTPPTEPGEGDDGGGEGPDNGEGPPPAGPPDGPPPASGASVSEPGPQHAAPTSLPPSPDVPGVPPESVTASRRLLTIDRSLRDRLLTTVNATMLRALERAGAKVVSKARTASAAAIRETIRDVPTYLVCPTLGPAVVASLGVDATEVVEAELAELAQQWDRWVTTGQEQALRAAASIAGLDIATAYAQLAGKFAEDRAAGWTLLADAMRDRARVLMAGQGGVDEAVVIEVDTMLTVGPVRAALARAGGYGTGASAGIGPDFRPADLLDRMGGIGTGHTIRDLLGSNGVDTEAYQWVHGYSENPFEPHLDLDGIVFYDFADDTLAAGGDAEWLGSTEYFPGDHGGCMCDFMPIYVPTGGGA